MNKALKSIGWFRIRADFETKNTLNTFAYSVFEAVTKEIKSDLNYEKDIIFHLKEKTFNQTLRAKEKLTLELILPKAALKESFLWAEALEKYFQDTWNARNVSLIKVEKPQLRNYEILESEKTKQISQRTEICLNFLTPLPIKLKHPKKRTYIEKSDFFRLFHATIEKLFDIKLLFPYSDESLKLLLYWDYEEFPVNSMSQQGSTRLINGCMGKVYLKGDLEGVIPLILICEELHLEGTLSYGRGYYIISPEPQTSFINPQKFVDTLQFYVEKNRDQMDNSSINEVTAQLYNAIITSNYQPQPPEAFIPNGTQIVTEKFHWKDRVVQCLLYKILKKPIDNMLPLTVFSFRPHFSEKEIKSKIEELINANYNNIALFSLERFYKEINHSYLIKALSELIPLADQFIVKLIEKFLKVGFIYNKTHQQPTKGLLLGSPLSAMLTNIYLLKADRALNSNSVVALRHADTYLLMSQSEEKLNETLNKARKILEEIGFKIDNSSIKFIKNENIKFAGIEIPCEKKIKNLRKPLYIVKPGLYLNIQSETIKISSSDETLETIPISRISEVTITENTSLSTQVLKKLIKNQIPIVISSNFNSPIVIVRRDYKSHFDEIYNHIIKYKTSSEEEILTYAKDIANLKLKSYEILFTSKRHPLREQIIEKLNQYRQKIIQSKSLHTVRGYEASASKQNYKALNLIIKNPQFHIKIRQRQNPDLINSLINICSHITFNKLRTIIHSQSLNPYLGFLHSPENNYESLCADIQELLRARLDSFIINLINLRIITEKDFQEVEISMKLNSKGVRKVLNHLEEYFNKTYNADGDTLYDFIHRQIYRIKKWVKQEVELKFEIPW